MKDIIYEPDEGCNHIWIDMGEGWFRCTKCGREEEV